MFTASMYGTAAAAKRANAERGEDEYYEQRARELLAAEYEAQKGQQEAADIRTGNIDWWDKAAIRAITAALRTAGHRDSAEHPSEPVSDPYTLQPSAPEPVAWTDEEVLRFMSIALRHAQYKKGCSPTVDEVRDGFRLMRVSPPAPRIDDAPREVALDQQADECGRPMTYWGGKGPAPQQREGAPLRPVTEDDVDAAVAAYIRVSGEQGSAGGFLAALESFRSRLAGEGA